MYDRLAAHFDRRQIFIDVDTLKPGVDFIEAIERSVGSCDVLIAVIGAYWVDAADEQGYRRLDNPEDFVRMEIATALRREIRVIPVLIDGASMPKMAELPDDLKPLVRRNALPLSDTRFDDDCRRLVATIEQVFESTKAERSGFTEKVRPEKRPSADQQWEKAGRERSEGTAPSIAAQSIVQQRNLPRERLANRRSNLTRRKRLPWWIWGLSGVGLCGALAGLTVWAFVRAHFGSEPELIAKTPSIVQPKQLLDTPTPRGSSRSTPIPASTLTATPIPTPIPTPFQTTIPTPLPTPAIKSVPAPIFAAIPTPARSTPAQPTSVDPNSDVLEFVRKFWSDCVSKDPNEWASDFADQARYCYNPGRLTNRSFIRHDRAVLLDRYPLRHYEFSDPSVQMEPGNNAARVTFSFNYRYSGRKPATGTCLTTLSVERISGSWLITEYDEQVDRQ
jgi:hypothetical protein